MNLPRRDLVRAATALGLSSLSRPTLARIVDPARAAAPAPTPPLTDGPYYPVAFDRAQTDTLIKGPLVPQARPLQLTGRVLDRAGRPVPGAR